jgi:predicted Rossmann-fold nucleotide-binding protein
MSIDPALWRIAVFGSNTVEDDELAAARSLGIAVNRAKAVLLTGGDLIDAETVKDAAVWAAHGAGKSDAPATWIGVANKDKVQAPQPRGPLSMVVTPGWNHRRNFVEACLCDAAIAIGGSSDGTASEALFCLYLNRPVVIVGDLPEAEVAPIALRERARKKRIPWPKHPNLSVDHGIAEAYAWADHPDNSAKTGPLPVDDVSAETLVTELIGRITQPAQRPDFDSLVDETAWDGYVRTAVDDAGR